MAKSGKSWGGSWIIVGIAVVIALTWAVNEFSK